MVLWAHKWTRDTTYFEFAGGREFEPRGVMKRVAFFTFLLDNTRRGLCMGAMLRIGKILHIVCGTIRIVYNNVMVLARVPTSYT